MVVFTADRLICTIKQIDITLLSEEEQNLAINEVRNPVTVPSGTLVVLCSTCRHLSLDRIWGRDWGLVKYKW